MLYPKVGVPIIGKDLLSRYMQYQYERCLTRAGASVWLLPYYMEPEQLETIITTCSGFLFPAAFPAVFLRRTVHVPAERPVKIADVGVTAFKGYGADGEGAVPQHTAGFADAVIV